MQVHVPHALHESLSFDTAEVQSRIRLLQTVVNVYRLLLAISGNLPDFQDATPENIWLKREHGVQTQLQTPASGRW